MTVLETLEDYMTCRGLKKRIVFAGKSKIPLIIIVILGLARKFR